MGQAARARAGQGHGRVDQGPAAALSRGHRNVLQKAGQRGQLEVAVSAGIRTGLRQHYEAAAALFLVRLCPVDWPEVCMSFSRVIVIVLFSASIGFAADPPVSMRTLDGKTATG